MEMAAVNFNLTKEYCNRRNIPAMGQGPMRDVAVKRRLKTIVTNFTFCRFPFPVGRFYPVSMF
jgi:hypothetical protein